MGEKTSNKRNQQTAKPSTSFFIANSAGNDCLCMQVRRSTFWSLVPARLRCASVMQRHVPRSPGDNGNERQDETVPALVWQLSAGSHRGLGALLMPLLNSCLLTARPDPRHHTNTIPYCRRKQQPPSRSRNNRVDECAGTWVECEEDLYHLNVYTETTL